MTDRLATAGLPGTIVHDEVVPARAPWMHTIKAGQTLRIVDMEGNQAVDFLAYAAGDDAERYSAQDTIAAQRNIFLRTGSVLLSNEGRPMMTITGTSKVMPLGALTSTGWLKPRARSRASLPLAVAR